MTFQKTYFLLGFFFLLPHSVTRRLCLCVCVAAALVVVSEVADQANDNLKQGVSSGCFESDLMRRLAKVFRRHSLSLPFSESGKCILRNGLSHDC